MKKALALVLVLVLALGLVIPHVGCGVQDIGDQTAMTTAGPGRIDVDNIPGGGVTGGTDHDFCEAGEPYEWHFLINGLDPKEAAPAYMTAVFAVEGEVSIPLETVTGGGVAHYTVAGYLDATLVGAYAYLEEPVTYNGFILSHAPCDDDCGDDSDGDGVPDCNDGCPNDPNKTEPGVCGCGVADTDTDGDGTEDCNDGCPNDPNKTEPGVCGCGVADTDTDGDGTEDCNDGCPTDPNKADPGVCGCGTPDGDTDNDGTPDCNDECPTDANKTDPGVCGCGTPDDDTDNDGTPDCSDGCPTDPDKIDPGVCGCGVADTDTDGDGTLDCNDQCPNDPSKTEPGDCGCGVADTDSDGDGTLDCNDGCPNDPNKTEPGVCGCGVADTDTDGDGTPDCNDSILDCSDLGPGEPTRTLPDQVLPGERFQVTVVFTAPYDGFHAIALTDVAPDGWDVSVNVASADPEATAVHTPTAETAAYVWYGPYDVCVVFTTVYEVGVQVNAEPGTYTFGGILKYYIEPHPAPAYEQEVTGDMQVRVEEGETVKIEGVAKEVDGAILSGAAVVLYQNGEAIGNVVSDESGNYGFEFSELGDYEVMVSKAGFRGETQSISVAALAIYTLDFVGAHGLIPDAPSMSYVLACISLWKFGEPPLQLSTSRVLDVTSAWTYPIT
jgi:hypothetical protein